MAKKILIVFANEEHRSLNGALLKTAKETFEKQGHEVTISDLFALNWDPVTRRTDIKADLSTAEVFNYGIEISKAVQEGTLSSDVQAEMTKVDEADFILFQFPFYWMGLPAILKGWFDKVFAMHYAWKPPTGILEDARFVGKRAMLSFTTAGPGNFFTFDGLMGDLNVSLWNIQFGILRFCGLDVLKPNSIHSVVHKEIDFSAQISSFAKRMENVFDEEPLKFLGKKDFTPIDASNPRKGLIVKAELREGQEFGPTVGHHCGKRVPAV